MKIQYHSDLHLEFQFGLMFDFNISPDADVLVFAGDISTRPTQVVDFFNKIREKTSIPIVYVLGNHEYYGLTTDAIFLYHMHLSSLDSVYVLDRRSILSVEIGGVMFIGTTLYSDLSNPVNAQYVRNTLSDFRVVNGMTIEHWKNEYTRSVYSMKHEMDRCHASGKKVVVVTHFAPLRTLLDPAYYNSKNSDGFASDLSEMILDYSPNVWIYGHTHYNVDLGIGGTRIVSNQLGYPHEGMKLEIKTIEV